MATVTSIEVCKGFYHVILTLEHDRGDLPEYLTDDDGQPVGVEMREGDRYQVTGTGLYATARGFNTGDHQVYRYRDLDDAKAKANGWYNNLINKGYTRIK